MACSIGNLILLVTLTLTLLVASANGFNVLRGTRHLSRKEAAETAQRSTEMRSFGIVLDAGSSGTKTNVFEFDFKPGSSGPPVLVSVMAQDAMKVKPALHTYADKSMTELRDYFTGIFDKLCTEGICQHLPVSDTVLYVMGTAGMRGLRDSDSEKAENLIQNVINILSDENVNRFQFSADNFQILSGQEEGAYAWLAANFLNGFFNTSMSRNDSVGLLEMGGSSLQLAYMPFTHSGSGCTVEVTSEQPATLHVDSYAGLGANGVHQQVEDTLCDRGTEVENPCMLTGDNDDITCNGDQKVVVNGTGNPKTCKAILRSIVKNVNHTAAGDLLFYAIGSICYPPKTLQAVDDRTGLLNVDTLKTQANDFCQMKLAEAIEYKGSSKYVSSDCTIGLFIPELLTELGLHDSSIQMCQEIKAKTINWALGAALDLMTPNITVRCNARN